MLLWTIASIFVLLWVIGLGTSYTFHGFIHVFVILAIALIIVRIMNSRRHTKS
ncbi:MAG: lmo0937 family membrane protein [Deltaproteobacteria bacterium]|nr:lmo0937 family membrane protein [Deltaproteobacteria bacterium]